MSSELSQESVPGWSELEARVINRAPRWEQTLAAFEKALKENDFGRARRETAVLLLLAGKEDGNLTAWLTKLARTVEKLEAPLKEYALGVLDALSGLSAYKSEEARVTAGLEELADLKKLMLVLNLYGNPSTLKEVHEATQADLEKLTLTFVELERAGLIEGKFPTPEGRRFALTFLGEKVLSHLKPR
jgi:hypothetical protein